MRLELARLQPGHQLLGDVQRLDRHRLLVGEPEALRDDDRLDGDTFRKRPSRAPAGLMRRSSVRLLGRMPRRRMSSLNEGHRQLLRDLRLADEGPEPRRRTR